MRSFFKLSPSGFILVADFSFEKKCSWWQQGAQSSISQASTFFFMFEIDSDNCTVNPLRKDPRPCLTNETTIVGAGGSEKESRRETIIWLTVRFFMFVLIPLCVWFLNDEFVDHHFVLLTYLQVGFVIMLQGVLVQPFVKQGRNKLTVIMLITAVLYILTCIVFRVPHGSTKSRTVQNCECGECRYYTTDDISRELYPSFFSSGERVMGIGLDLNGTRLSQESIITVVTQLTTYSTIVNAPRGFEECLTPFVNMVLSLVLRPCDQSCAASRLTIAWCAENMPEKCIREFFSESSGTISSYERLLESITRFPLLPTKKDNELLYGLLGQGLSVYKSLPGDVDKSFFCSSPKLFTGEYEPFRCASKRVEYRETSHLNAKISWTTLSCLIWIAVSTFTPRLKRSRKPYTRIEVTELGVCFAFLGVGFAFLSQKFHIVDESGKHGVAALLLIVLHMMLTTILSLYKGKTPRETHNEDANIIMRWYGVFKRLTDVHNGPYYFVYIVGFELAEITVQLASFDVMVRTNDISYEVASVWIISLNLILTPLAFLTTRMDQTWGRKLTYITDTLLESAYLVVNLGAIRQQDLTQVSVVLSILFPLFTLLLKVDTYVEAVSTYVESKGRRDSWLTRSIKKGKDMFKIKFSLPKKQKCVFALIGTAMSTLGLSFFIFMMISAQRMEAECAKIVGKDIWNGARPRHVFKDGPFTPSCHFDTIKEVKAQRKNINALQKEIGLLTSLTYLDLAGNSIRNLPVEISKLHFISYLDMEGCPVWKSLDWQSQSLDAYPKILGHFSELERLNLAHNGLTKIPGSIGRLEKLTILMLQNNSVHYLSQEITKLSALKVLNVTQNPVASTLTWHGVDPKGALRIFRHLTTLSILDISKGRFKDGDLKEIVRAVPSLQKLNVSQNLLVFPTVKYSNITELDVSNNDGMHTLLWTYGKLLSIHLGTGDSLRLLRLKFTQLESIDVRGLTNLIEFDASHNKIGNVGCQSFLELVKNGSLPSLGFLDLSNNTNISSELKDKFRRVWREKGKGTYYLRFTP